MRLDAFVERTFDLEVLDYRLDHPVAVFQIWQVVLEIADRDEVGDLGRKERGGLRLLRGLEAGLRDAISDGGRVERQPQLQLFGRQFFGRNVEQQTRNAGVGQMPSDLRAHYTCAQYRGLFDLHRLFLPW